ncbi:FAD-binding oxidoreductase [Egibacter rhizosphaerae]|uniref:FAD-binding oxidoreductase n=1 Tax=Egibacter rhizosphaerae TaxID=1670831 RepID=UPI00197AC866|nr:FAD-binding oxidoreductase [Egibacter rhizosphaerae]
MTDALTAELRALVGEAHVLDDPQLTAPYGSDWTGRWERTPRLVIRPGTTDEVAHAVRACSDAGVPVVPQGGNTGLVGGSVPHEHEAVLSLRRLDRLGTVQPLDRTVTVGAGATLAAVQAHVRPHGLAVGVDLAARSQATLGGMVATNAGGVHVLAHGMMRAQVRGVEAVLADGRVLRRLGGLEKDNVGYDLPGLFAGSEGTLAVITGVTLRLVDEPAHRVVALCALDGWRAAVELTARARREVRGLVAAEAVSAEALELVIETAGLPPPFEATPGCALLLEVAGPEEPTDELAAVVERAADDLDVGEVAVGTDARDRARLWAYREHITEGLEARGVPVKLDVTLPPRELAGFVEGLEDHLPESVRAYTFGHVGDGNVHVNLLRDALVPAERLEDTVLELVVARDGSISAEHGIGVAKAGWLGRVRDDTDLATMAALRGALDPTGVLNPAVLRAH